jgi:hypothetical protein
MLTKTPYFNLSSEKESFVKANLAGNKGSRGEAFGMEIFLHQSIYLSPYHGPKA